MSGKLNKTIKKKDNKKKKKEEAEDMSEEDMSEEDMSEEDLALSKGATSLILNVDPGGESSYDEHIRHYGPPRSPSPSPSPQRQQQQSLDVRDNRLASVARLQQELDQARMIYLMEKGRLTLAEAEELERFFHQQAMSGTGYRKRKLMKSKKYKKYKKSKKSKRYKKITRRR